MCDISYRQTKAGWNRRKQGGAKDREEGRDGITQEEEKKEAATFNFYFFFFFSQGQWDRKNLLPEPKGRNRYS